ncbi:hypothetical protein [[Mycobacterium] zoologicum]|uniref:hypothetical protein n=1 Tax=[Mycobacterium] zoologicum TaxID=2872311 RepID=UPI001CDADEBF|nr:hypothetical protein [Mycolicibacter sp. MYC101]MEB3063756.1 hypothetical protein [Mycolicibacter sp. MYC101]
MTPLEPISVPAELASRASQWNEHAAVLAGDGATTVVSAMAAQGQPSAVAMSAVLAGVGHVSTKMAARITTSAANVTQANAVFDANEAAAAAALTIDAVT